MKFKQKPDVILKELGIYEPEDIDLDLVAFSLGADIKRSALSDCEGSIIGTDKKAIITINSDSDLNRQRFSLGHELGHWVNDRGNNLTYRCNSNDMKQHNSSKKNFRQQKEVRANKFSAELMMPHHIFNIYLKDLNISVESINYLSKIFNTSRTSTAIRMVELNELPCMLICWDKTGNRKWFYRNSIVPENIWPYKKILRPVITSSHSDSLEVDADKWIDIETACDYSIIESTFENGYDFLTLIWWKDETFFSNL